MQINLCQYLNNTLKIISNCMMQVTHKEVEKIRKWTKSLLHDYLCCWTCFAQVHVFFEWIFSKCHTVFASFLYLWNIHFFQISIHCARNTLTMPAYHEFKSIKYYSPLQCICHTLLGKVSTCTNLSKWLLYSLYLSSTCCWIQKETTDLIIVKVAIDLRIPL